ncbi:MAG: hypothetical protein ABW185_00560 [Sedimenticola sp.]
MNNLPNAESRVIADKNPVNEHPTRGFVAVQRKKVITYYIGNVDKDCTDNDIKYFLKQYDIFPTQITLYRNSSGTSVRINIPSVHMNQVESDGFWPDGMTCRRWQSSREWARVQDERKREYEERKRTRNDRDRYEERPRNLYRSSYDTYDTSNNGQDYYQQSDRRRTEYRDKYNDETDNMDQDWGGTKRSVRSGDKDLEQQRQWIDWYERTELRDP